MQMTLETLIGAIHQWGRERGIHQNGRLDSQAEKLVEEANETLEAARKLALHPAVKECCMSRWDELRDGIGDTFVVLVQLCAISGIELEEAIDSAYLEIRDRKGFLNEDGVFVKESE